MTLTSTWNLGPSRYKEKDVESDSALLDLTRGKLFSDGNLSERDLGSCNQHFAHTHSLSINSEGDFRFEVSVGY